MLLSPLQMDRDQSSRPSRWIPTVPGTESNSGAMTSSGPMEQVRSFEADVTVNGLGDEPLRAVFIRAPWIESVGDDVEVLAELDGHPVVARQRNLLVTSFHPELTDDLRVHALFLALAGIQSRVGA